MATNTDPNLSPEERKRQQEEERRKKEQKKYEDGIVTGFASGMESGAAGNRGVELGSDIVDAVSSGINDSLNNVTDAGASIADTLLGSILESLGETGNGIRQVLGGALRGVTGVATEVFGGITDLLTGTFRTASALATGVGGAIGAAIGAAAGGAPGAALGLAIGAAIGNMVGEIAQQITQMFGDLVGHLGAILGKLGQALGQVVSGIMTVLNDAIQSARKLAQEILSIRYNTGLSTQQAAGAYFGLRSVGVSGGTISGMLADRSQAPWMFDARARAFGATGYTDPQFVEKLAARYQSLSGQGRVGNLRALSMMDNLGMNNPEMLRVVNTPVEQLQDQRQWSEKVNKSLGMSPTAIERIGQRIELLIQRLEYFSEVAKARLAQELLPMLEGMLDAATNFLAQNADKIAASIHTAMEWTYAVLPKLILNAASAVMSSISGMMHGLARMLREFASGEGFLYQIMHGVAQFWDLMTEGLKSAYAVGKTVMEGMKMLMVQLASPIIRPLVEQIVGPTVGPLDLTDVYNNAYNAIPSMDLTGMLDNFKNSGKPEKWADSLDAGADTLDIWSKNVQDFNKSLGTEDERRQQFNAMIGKLNSIENHTKRSADALTKPTDGMTNGEFHARAYVEALLVQGFRRARTR